MINKKGVLGGTVVMIFSIIAIVIILLIFALGASLVKVADSATTGVSVMDECDVGVDDVFVHAEDFRLLSFVKYSVAKGDGLDFVLTKYGAEKSKNYDSLDEELAVILDMKIEFGGKTRSIKDAIVFQFGAYDGLANMESSSGGSFLDYVIKTEGPGYLYKAGRTSESRFLNKDVDKLIDGTLELSDKIKDVLSEFSKKYSFEMPFRLITHEGVKADGRGTFGDVVGMSDVVETDLIYDGIGYRVSYRRSEVCHGKK